MSVNPSDSLSNLVPLSSPPPLIQINYSNAEVYMGGVFGTKPHGLGLLILANGRRLMGEFDQGFINGPGVIEYPSEKVYKGNLLKNVPSGVGIKEFPEGDVYKGNFVDGKRTGLGIFQWEDGETYEGQFDKGRRIGLAVFNFNDGGCYKGPCFNQAHTGLGVKQYSSGHIFEGELVDDSPHGVGVYTYNEGSIYEGGVEDGLRHGYGVIKFNTGVILRSNFVKGFPDSNAAYHYPNGDIFYGQIKDGLRHGKGRLVMSYGVSISGNYKLNYLHGQGIVKYPDGGVYKGEFVQDLWNGKGTYKNSNGSSYTGEFKNGVRHGHGTYTYSNGDSITGNFSEGNPILPYTKKLYTGVLLVFLKNGLVTIRLRNKKEVKNLNPNSPKIGWILAKEARLFEKEASSRNQLLKTSAESIQKLLEELNKSPSTTKRRQKSVKEVLKKTTSSSLKNPFPDQATMPCSTQECDEYPSEAPVCGTSNDIDETFSSLTHELHTVKISHRLLARVNRWKTKDPKEIRSFEDRRSDGSIIRRYEKFSDAIIMRLRARHRVHWLVVLLASKLAKDRYVKTTERGYSIMCEITYADKTKEFGNIYFGIDMKKVYHCYFEPTITTCDHSNDGEANECLEKNSSEDWVCARPDFKIVQTDLGEALLATFVGEDHSLLIYPLH